MKRAGMRRAGRRARLATGIYADACGVAIIVRNKEYRYPLGTPLDELRRARLEILEALDASPARLGTLAADVEAYLLTLPEGPRRRDARALLRHWVDAGFGAQPRGAISAMAIHQQLVAWAARFRPATRKHLRRELGALYGRLNGKAGANPVRDVPQITVRYDEPRGISYDMIRRILDALPDQGRPADGKRSRVSLTKLRLTLLAFTGLPPAVLGRVVARDLDLAGATVYARPRRKGAGSPGYLQPLTPQAVAAFRALVRAGGLGPFSTRSIATSWRRAVAKVREAWRAEHAADGLPWPLPDDVRPYDLRHSFATAVLRQRKSLRVVADLLMHTNLNTTRRYTQGVINQESREAVDDVADVLGPASAVSKTLPRRAGKMAENGRQWPAAAGGGRRR